MTVQSMPCLWDVLATNGQAPGDVATRLGSIHGIDASVTLADLASRSSLAGKLVSLRDRVVLVATRDQLTSALALLELDGVARRLVICTPDLSIDQLTQVARVADADAIVVDAGTPADRRLEAMIGMQVTVDPGLSASLDASRSASAASTEWVLLTSGTTGAPKLVGHTLHSLAGALPHGQPLPAGTVWSTFYDIRRYGGLQIFLRAVLGGAALVLSSAGEAPADFLARLGAAGVTHISGTPSHWRRALMSGAASRMAPAYVRLSGEIADQSVLDRLHQTYPQARVGHAFASTEAGVAFDVNDGLAGFPAGLIGQAASQVDMKVEGGTLHIRSARTSSGYLGEAASPIKAADAYVDTGDMVELREGRYHFVGRKGGVINVGGLKVHPEEVEAVINADPRVRMSRVRARKNPLTGSIVVADVVLAVGSSVDSAVDSAVDCAVDCADKALAVKDVEQWNTVKRDLLQRCRDALPAHKVPASLRLVEALPLSAAGKLERPGD